jgi:DNA-directed RNA polymerase specialized sigma24 family protein
MTALAFHEHFTALLPQLTQAARFAFRGRNVTDQEEAVADVQAAAWSAWHGLIKRGKNPLEIGPIGILNNAIKYVRHGRRVGNPGSGRGRTDLWQRKTQRLGGFKLVRLADAQRDGTIRAWVASDHRSTPATHAVFLIDFQDWLGRLSERRRQSALLLAEGFGTREVSQQLGISPSAISQTRAALEQNWAQFQADTLG